MEKKAKDTAAKAILQFNKAVDDIRSMCVVGKCEKHPFHVQFLT